MSVLELLELTVTGEIIIWDYKTSDFLGNGEPLSYKELHEFDLLEKEVLSIEGRMIGDTDYIVANIDTSMD